MRAERRRLMIMASSLEFRQRFHVIGNALLDCVGRGVTLGLLLGAAICASSKGPDELLRTSAIYPVIGGAIGSSGFSGILFRTYIGVLDPTDRAAHAKFPQEHPLLTPLVVPIVATTLLALDKLIQYLIGLTK
jgi:hypothetical protein